MRIRTQANTVSLLSPSLKRIASLEKFMSSLDSICQPACEHMRLKPRLSPARHATTAAACGGRRCRTSVHGGGKVCASTALQCVALGVRVQQHKHGLQTASCPRLCHPHQLPKVGKGRPLRSVQRVRMRMPPTSCQHSPSPALPLPLPDGCHTAAHLAERKLGLHPRLHSLPGRGERPLRERLRCGRPDAQL